MNFLNRHLSKSVLDGLVRIGMPVKAVLVERDPLGPFNINVKAILHSLMGDPKRAVTQSFPEQLAHIATLTVCSSLKEKYESGKIDLL